MINGNNYVRIITSLTWAVPKNTRSPIGWEKREHSIILIIKIDKDFFRLIPQFLQLSFGTPQSIKLKSHYISLYMFFFFNAACYNTVSSGYLWLRRRQFCAVCQGNVSKKKTNPVSQRSWMKVLAVFEALRDFHLHGLRNWRALGSIMPNVFLKLEESALRMMINVWNIMFNI